MKTPSTWPPWDFDLAGSDERNDGSAYARESGEAAPLASNRLDCIVVTGADALAGLTRPELILDRQTLEGHAAIPTALLPPTLAPHSATALRDRASWFVAKRIAKQHAKKLAMPIDRLATALLFPVMCEICTVLPLRHLARRLASLADGDPVVVPLTKLRGRYLRYWSQSDIEPFLLVNEINRQGGRAVLALTEPRSAWMARRTGRFTFRLAPHGYWKTRSQPLKEWMKPMRWWSPPAAKALAVLAGVRDPASLLQAAEDPLIVASSMANRKLGYDVQLARNAAPAPPVLLRFERKDTSHRTSPDQWFSCRLPHAKLSDWLPDTVGARLAAMSAAADALASDGIEQAHVCDHLFAESALVAGAVAKSSGRTTLWPHSTNPVHRAVWAEVQPARVIAVTESAADEWRAKLPHAVVSVRSNGVLPAPALPPRFVEGAPLTVVVIAGSHSLLRMPLVDIDRHRQLYRDLFAGLHRLGSAVRVEVKAKRPWESGPWLMSHAPPCLVISEAREPPAMMTRPNMIFLTVSLASSALLEGIGRGVPAMVVREGPVEDYVAIDPAVVPAVPPDVILSEIEACCSGEKYEALRKLQADWFRAETHFGEL